MTERSPGSHDPPRPDGLPAPLGALRDLAEPAFDGYAQFRSHVMADRADGLDLVTKELIFVVLNVIYENEASMFHHLKAAQRSGLSLTSLVDALLQVMLVGGNQTWVKSGYRLILAALDFDPSDQ